MSQSDQAYPYQKYPKEGICDVCNGGVGAGEAYMVPVSVFYSSKKYREWLSRGPMAALIGDVDAFIAQSRLMDKTTHSAVCPKCIHMFPSGTIEKKPEGAAVAASGPRCRECSGQNRPVAVYCRHCGSLLEKKAEPSAGTASEQGMIGEAGALFWFNWQKISESGNGWYGRYVYQNLLPCFAPAGAEMPEADYTFFDGDFLPGRTVNIPHSGGEEGQCLERIKREGMDLFYIVAVHGTGQTNFAEVDRRIRSAGVTGYAGKTSCSGMGFVEFSSLASSLALPLSLKISRGSLVKMSFGFIADDELRSMGFKL